MKTKTLLFTLLLFAVTAFAQDRGYVAIALGSSIPIGDFASTDPNNTGAGYATEGLNFNISFNEKFKFSKYFGISLLARIQANATDAQSLADQIAQQSPGVSTSVNSTSWSIIGSMVGAYGSFPISEKWSLESKIMFGFLTATSPDITVNLSGPGGYGSVETSNASSTAFSYLFGVGFKYNIGKHWCLLYNLDYLGAKPEFSNVVTTSNVTTTTANTVTSTNATYSQSFGTINNNFGIGYRFGKKKLSIKDL
jgi:hypothetical protein